MDTGIQALLVLMAFSAVHERVIELIRRVLLGRAPKTAMPGATADSSATLGLAGSASKVRTFLEGATVGPWSVAVATALAVVTKANLLLLFQQAKEAKQSAFFDAYMNYGQGAAWHWTDTATWDLRVAMGTLLMGLSTTLGSKFWHDLAYGLMDVRKGAAETIKSVNSPGTAR